MSDEMSLLIGEEHGVLRLSSRDGGRTWSGPEPVLPNVEAHTVRGAPDGTVYAGTRGDGLFRSNDGGRDWEQVETPPELRNVRSLFISGDRFLVGTEPAGVYEWADGKRWLPVGDVQSCAGASEWWYPVQGMDHHIRHLSIDPRHPERIFAAVQVGGVAITPDNGDSWIDRRNLDLDVHMVEPHPTRAGTVYAGTGGKGLFRSVDDGETWEIISHGCGNFVVEFALDPRDPARIYLGTGRGGVREWRENPAVGARGEVFRSDDGGQSWRKLRGGLPEQMQSRIDTLIVDAAEPSNVFIGAGGGRRNGAQDGGIFHSSDRGESWNKIASVDDPLALCCVRG